MKGNQRPPPCRRLWLHRRNRLTWSTSTTIGSLEVGASIDRYCIFVPSPDQQREHHFYRIQLLYLQEELDICLVCHECTQLEVPAAMSFDYLWKISLKMQSMEARIPMPVALAQGVNLISHVLKVFCIQTIAYSIPSDYMTSVSSSTHNTIKLWDLSDCTSLDSLIESFTRRMVKNIRTPANIIILTKTADDDVPITPDEIAQRRVDE
ncbi:unnamed protein product [Lactuca saligna]|uniref:Uncharacterized protein n=1 Tax=Lactuca saligna TaxID=75948 RepID=A0AA36E431_LACSI|nr:unnamed protein product [Lactuca saligna]